MKFSIIIPTYNEVDNISKCLDTIANILLASKYSNNFYVLVTDARSPDGTAQKVKEMQNKYAFLELINEPTKQGLGKAYIDAMEYSFSKLNVDAVVTFDADLSHDPKILPEIFSNLENGSSLVIGSRYKKGGGIPENWGFHRKLLSRFGNLFIRVLYFRAGISDFTSGYKGITKDLFYKINNKIQEHKGYTFAISTHIEASRLKCKISEIPYKFVDREIGKSKMGPEYLVNGLKFVSMSFINDVLSNRFIKVFFTGGIGAISQFLSYGLIFYPLIEGSEKSLFELSKEIDLLGFKFFPRFFLSQLFAIEIGVITTFTVNNLWSFRDKKLTGLKFVKGFIKNHLVVAGAIIIQLIIGQSLKMLFGPGLIRQYIYQIIGILIGLVWNFYFYKKLIWKVHK